MLQTLFSLYDMVNYTLVLHFPSTLLALMSACGNSHSNISQLTQRSSVQYQAQAYKRSLGTQFHCMNGKSMNIVLPVFHSSYYQDLPAWGGEPVGNGKATSSVSFIAGIVIFLYAKQNQKSINLFPLYLFAMCTSIYIFFNVNSIEIIHTD